jgi:hypothetical protein
MLVGEEKPWAQVERIIESDTFHASGVLRRLFRFLADKTFSGEADQLKEYSIGIDAFGKPPTYDPRQDAIVRLQIGRLRQKLGEYYRTEGKDDPVIMELPKGRFKLSWQLRSAPVAPLDPVSTTDPGVAPRRWRRFAIALAGALLVSVVWGAYSAELLWRDRQNEVRSTAWTPELEQLWHPLLVTKRPVILAIADPLFIGMQGTDVFFRKVSLNRWEDVNRTPEVLALRKVLGNPKLQPANNFSPRGEVISSFLIGRLLGTRRQDISLSGSSQVPLQGLAENNIVLVGPAAVLDKKLPGIQVQSEFALLPPGIRNLHPRLGEPSFFADQPPGGAPDDGEVYALISDVPGPLGSTDLISFTSNRTWGRQGAVQSFTDPALARIMVNKLRKPSGELPRFYQIVVKVKFTDGLPTDIAYVLHRDLRPL